jgi:hypothetical protein
MNELFVESRGIRVDLGVQETLAVDVTEHLTELLVESWFSPRGHSDRLAPMVSSLICYGSKEVPLHQTHNLFIEREGFIHLETHHAPQIAYRSRLDQQVGWKVGNLLQVREQPELVTVYQVVDPTGLVMLVNPVQFLGGQLKLLRIGNDRAGDLSVRYDCIQRPQDFEVRA